MPEGIFYEYWRLVDEPIFINAEAVVQRCSVKKMFLEISQSSQEKNTFFHKTPPVAASEMTPALHQ